MALQQQEMDHLATHEEAQAVRLRSDLRNLTWSKWLLGLMILINLVASFDAIEEGAADATAMVGFAMVLVCASLLLVLRRVEILASPVAERWLDRIAAFVRRYFRATILVYLILQFAVFQLVTVDPDNVSWVVNFPLFLLAYRFLPSETILLFGSIFGISALSSLVVGALVGGGAEMEVLLVTAIWVPIAAIVALALTWRFRRRFLREWRAVRARYTETRRMRQELEFAREIQLSMLPAAPPEIDWLDLATISLPASEVGGDYYDFFELDDDRVALVIGDVAGHGLASGLVLSGIRSCLNLLSAELGTPAVVLEKLHRMLRETSRHRMLVTLSVVVIDRVRRRLTISCAGHPPMLVRTTDGLQQIEAYAPPLGTGLSSEFSEETVDLEENFELILQTDGVYEAADEDGELYGFERLEHAVRETSGTSAATRDAILRDLWEFKGEAPQRDDITLIVARPAASGWGRPAIAPVQSSS